MDYIEIIVYTLLIAVVASIIATGIIDGLKASWGTEDKPKFNRILALVIDTVIDLWIYCVVLENGWNLPLGKWFTFVIIVLATWGGADYIYGIIKKLNELKANNTETVEEDVEVAMEEGQG